MRLRARPGFRKMISSMSPPVRRLRPDGIVQLLPRHARVERQEWWLLAFTTLLVTGALFISTAIPAHVFGMTILCWLGGEVSFIVVALASLRHPPAEVEVLAQVRRARRRG